MLQRLITLTVWALVGWTALTLALRLLPSALQAPAGAQALAPEAPPPASLSRLFGAPPPEGTTAVAAPPADSRFRLIGVVAPRQARLQTEQGVALLSIDGGPAKAYRVGQQVDGELRLLAVEAHAVGLGQGGVIQIQLQLPPPSPAATGSLAPTMQIGAAPPVQQPPQQPYPNVPMPSVPEQPVPGDPSGPRRAPPEQTR